MKAKVKVPLSLLSKEEELTAKCKEVGAQFAIGIFQREEFKPFSPGELENFSDPIFSGITGLTHILVDFGPPFGTIQILKEGQGVEIWADFSS